MVLVIYQHQKYNVSKDVCESKNSESDSDDSSIIPETRSSGKQKISDHDLNIIKDDTKELIEKSKIIN